MSRGQSNWQPQPGLCRPQGEAESHPAVPSPGHPSSSPCLWAACPMAIVDRVREPGCHVQQDICPRNWAPWRNWW